MDYKYLEKMWPNRGTNQVGENAHLQFLFKKKAFSIFKVAADTLKKPPGQYPKEVRNRHKK